MKKGRRAMRIEIMGEELSPGVHECILCASFTPPINRATTVLVILEDDRIFDIIICDTCRRKLCTCGSCVAYVPTVDRPNPGGPLVVREYGTCRSERPKETEHNGWSRKVSVDKNHWCYKEFVQAGPFSQEEIRDLIGGELVAGSLDEGNDTNEDEEQTNA